MKLFKNYGLSLILLALFLLSWLGHGVFQWQEFVNQAAEHGQKAEISHFWSEFLAATLENWQSEFLQLFSFVVLATYFIHKGSPQSKDGDEEMQATLNRIEKALERKK